jgi:probable HAF family extracellular repeat protein
MGINAAGTIVGASYGIGPAKESHAVRWELDGTLTDLGTLPLPPTGGGYGSAARAINSTGTIVGSSTAADRHAHAVRWN